MGFSLCGRWSAALLAGSLMAACAEPDDRFASDRFAISQPGPWSIPADVLAAGDLQHVEYTGAGPWLGEKSCAGGPTPGAVTLRDYLESYFPQIEFVGGYSCRASTGDMSQASVHASGRALDLMLPLAGGDADNDLGDPIGNWLIENAESVGIQYIIWDRYTWDGSQVAGSKDGPYRGPNPHVDHLHIELSVAAAAEETDFFRNPPGPPDTPACGFVAAAGAVIDDVDACVQVFGPADFWRVEEGRGYGDRLLWTNAFTADAPSNWARWQLTFEAAGRYDLQVYIEPEFGLHEKARYEVLHGGELSTVYVNLRDADRWQSLGEFDFDTGGEQHLALFDDSADEIPEGQRIVVDALRVAPAAADVSGGCAAGGSTSPAGLCLSLFAGALALFRRRSAKAL